MKISTEDLISAAEARKIINDGAYQKAQDQMKMVIGVIRRAIEDGKGVVTGEGGLEPCVIMALKEKGYESKNTSHHNETCWSVSW